MTTVIDSLVVALGLDASQFTKQQREALEAFRKTRDEAKKTGDAIEHHAKTTGEFFGVLSQKVLELASAYIGFNAIKSGIEGTTHAMVDLGRTLALTGADSRFLQAFAMAVERIGGSADKATSEVEGLIEARTRMLTKGQVSPEFLFSLDRIGVDNPLTATWQDYLTKFAAFAENNKANPAMVTMIGRGLGLGGSSIQELMRGPRQLEADLALSRELGISTKAQIEASQRLTASTIGLGQAFEDINKKLLLAFGPTAGSMMDRLTKLLSHTENLESRRYRLQAPELDLLPRAWRWFRGEASGLGDQRSDNASGLGDQRSDNASGLGDQRSDNALPREPPNAQGYAPYLPPGEHSVAELPGMVWDKVKGGWNWLLNKQLMLENLFGILEGGPDNFVHPDSGAVGRYQIKPGTARLQKGFEDATTEKLKDPVYNRAVFDSIIADYMNRYKGDLDAVALAYHNGPSAADAFLARRGSQTNDYAGFGPQTLEYIRRLHEYTPSSLVSGAGSASTTTVTFQNLIVNVPPGSDGKGVARGIVGGLRDHGISVPSDGGLH